MEVWHHVEGPSNGVWAKRVLESFTFPRTLRGDLSGTLHSFIGAFALSREEDCYLVFTPREERALAQIIRPLVSCEPFVFLNLLCNDIKRMGLENGKIVTFLPVFVDRPPGNIRQQGKTRLAMWVRLHADMTQHPR